MEASHHPGSTQEITWRALQFRTSKKLSYHYFSAFITYWCNALKLSSLLRPAGSLSLPSRLSCFRVCLCRVVINFISAMMSKRLDMTKILLCCAFLLSLSVPLVRSQAAQPPLPGYSVYGQIMNNCGYDASVYVYYYDYNDYEQNFYVDVPSNGYTDILLCNGSLFDCTHGLPSYVYVWSANYTFPNSASPSQSYYIDVSFLSFS